MNHWKILRRACLWGMLLGAMACAPVGAMQGDRFVVPERFSFEPPAQERWKLTSQRKRGQLQEVVYRLKGGGARLRLQTWPHTKAQEQVPLEIIAQQVLFGDCAWAGGTPRLTTLILVELDQRLAAAMVGACEERPVGQKLSTVVTRSQGRFLSLTLVARPELFAGLAPELERLMRHLTILFPGPFDPAVLEELPQGPPGPYPGHQKPAQTPRAPDLDSWRAMPGL